MTSDYTNITLKINLQKISILKKHQILLCWKYLYRLYEQIIKDDSSNKFFPYMPIAFQYIYSRVLLIDAIFQQIKIHYRGAYHRLSNQRNTEDISIKRVINSNGSQVGQNIKRSQDGNSFFRKMYKPPSLASNLEKASRRRGSFHLDENKFVGELGFLKLLATTPAEQQREQKLPRGSCLRSWTSGREFTLISKSNRFRH